MIKNIFIIILLALVHPNTSQGQKLKRYDDFLFFKDAQSKQPITIINDSIVYKGTQIIPFKHTAYPDKLSEYLPFEIGTKTYLVHRGCGPVLEYRNDSIVRVDRSFLHKNQYDSTPFIFNNEIYLFGGYGLFTFKNIVTRYDFNSGEWNLEQTNGDAIPEPRTNGYIFKELNNIYIFGGNNADEKINLKTTPVNPLVWKLHLPTMTWSILGSYDPKILSDSDWRVQIKEKLYLFDSHITEIDIQNNTLKKYSFKNYENIKSHFVIGDTIYGIFATSEHQIYFKKTTIDDLKGKLIHTTPFFEQASWADFEYTKVGLIALVLVVLLSIGYIKRQVLFSKPFKGIVYDSQREIFLCQRKIITHFEENEKKVLHFLLKNNDQFVSLNQLNELFENPAQTETLSAIIKRREQAINGLLNKVSKLTGTPEEELLLERKNVEDKRIKDLLLLPQLLKKV